MTHPAGRADAAYLLDSALTAWRAGAFQLNTWTV